MNLNEDQIKGIRKILNNQSPGYLPYDLFIELSKFMVVPIIELVPLCKNRAGGIEVLLLKRSADDPFWPNLLQTPGTIVRVDDKDSSFDDAFDRLKNEIGVTSFNKNPVLFQNYYRTSERSKEVAMCYWVELNENDIVRGEWFRINYLPVNIVDNQIDLIQKAVKNFF